MCVRDSVSETCITLAVCVVLSVSADWPNLISLHSTLCKSVSIELLCVCVCVGSRRTRER